MNAKSKTHSAQRVVRGQSSWRLASSEVEAFVTETGGHLGPVTFDRQEKKIQPFSVAPWVEEKIDPSLPPILKVLRGDFFCLPFGGNSTPFKGERHPVHGETANRQWKFESLQAKDGQTCLRLSLTTKIRPGRVDKEITLVDGQNAVYSRHMISGMKGPINPGHHAMLCFPDAPGSGVISTSRFLYGQVFPGAFELPENRGYSALKSTAEFRSLEEVPTLAGGMADLSRYPARRGFEDLVMLVSDPSLPFAWTAVTFPKERFVWFALKNPNILRETIFWISNGGRHYSPWSGRHINVMGLEEVTSYFHLGLAESVRKNPVSEKGYPTYLTLNPKQPLVVPYIMGVAAAPAGFNRVLSIEAADGGSGIRLKAANGKSITTPLNLDFLRV